MIAMSFGIAVHLITGARYRKLAPFPQSKGRSAIKFTQGNNFVKHYCPSGCYSPDAECKSFSAQTPIVTKSVAMSPVAVSRQIVGWAMGNSLKAQLVLDA